jgi:TRAP-type C4-dicarboxylate transport system substrate-binding protein
MKRLSILVISLLVILSLTLSLSAACSTPQQTPTTTQAPPASSTTQPAQTSTQPAPTSTKPAQTSTQPAQTSTQPAKQVLIRMTTPVPAGDDLLVKSQAEMDKFNAATNGAYKMQMFPGGQLDQMPAMLGDIRTGAVEGGIIPPAAFSGEVPEFSIVELPFVFDSGEANAYAEIGLQPIYAKIMKEKCNQTSVGCIFIGGLYLLSTKPIHTLEDLKGLNIGCDTPSSAALMKALGGNGIVVDFSEDYSNLQKGIINAKTVGSQYVEIAKLYEIAKNATVFFALGSVYSININLDVYNKMPPDVQNLLNTHMSKLASDLSQYFLHLPDTLNPKLAEQGVVFYNLPKAELERWKAMAYPGTLESIAKFGDIGAQIKKLADDANAKYPSTAK